MEPKDILLFNHEGEQVTQLDAVEDIRSARALLQAGGERGMVLAIWNNPTPACGQEGCNVLLINEPDGISIRCQTGETLDQHLRPKAHCRACNGALVAEIDVIDTAAMRKMGFGAGGAN